MLNLKKELYKEYEIFYYEDKYLALGKEFVDKNFLLEEVYKDTTRNYVAKIKISNQDLIVKSPKSETILPQKKIMGILKKGEALTTLINLNKNIDMGLKNYVKPYVAILKKNIFLKESFLLMENISGTPINRTENLFEVLDLVVKEMNNIHEKGFYHGDLNTSNFIFYNNQIKIIDTQGKKDIFSNFKRSYDYLTLKEDLLVNECGYDIDKKYKVNQKKIGYLLAYLIKNIKKNKLMKKFRNLKKELRKKGWKI